VDDPTELGRCTEEISDPGVVSEVAEDESDEANEIVSSLDTQGCKEILPSTNVDATIENDRCDEGSQYVAAVSEVDAEISGEVKELFSSTATEECHENLPSSHTGEATEDYRCDYEKRGKIARDSEVDAEKSVEAEVTVRSTAMEACNEILQSTSVKETTEDGRCDEESEDKAGDLEVEAVNNGEVEEVSSPAVPESSVTLENNSVVEAAEINRSHTHRIIETEALDVETSKYEETGEVSKPQKGAEAQLQVDLSSTLEESLSANSLRLEGNKLFLQEDFYGATQLYTRGILQAMKEQEHSRSHGSAKKFTRIANGHGAESEVLLAYSNRAEAWIRLQEYEKGLEDAQKALALQPDHLKSLFRKGRALLGLHQYREAHSILQVRALFFYPHYLTNLCLFCEMISECSSVRI
jgi:tetratricopeptide (TPR) repeat protein